MKKNLKDYIVKLTSFLDDKICDETIKQLHKNYDWQQHTFYNSATGKYSPHSGSQELDILYTSDVNNTDIIEKKIWHGIDTYIKTMNYSWFSGWNGYTPIRYNRYSENRLMALHCDHIHSMFDGERKGVPILSCLGVLNNDYEGGEFVMFDDYKIDIKKGELLIFPSSFLYPHKVNPVTKGIRYSYISWVW